MLGCGWCRLSLATLFRDGRPEVGMRVLNADSFAACIDCSLRLLVLAMVAACPLGCQSVRPLGGADRSVARESDFGSRQQYNADGDKVSVPIFTVR